MSESQILRFPKTGMDKGMARYDQGGKRFCKPICRGGRGFTHHYHHYNHHSSLPLPLS